MKNRYSASSIGCALLLGLSVRLLAAGNSEVRAALGVAAASSEGQDAIKTFEIADGFNAALFAAEPMLANPVCFSTDEKGRWYVVNTFRLYAGTPDASEHPDWVVEDLLSRTVDDRAALLQRKYAGRLQELTDYSERITRIEDPEHEGKASRAEIFADGFNSMVDGLGAGVIAWRGDVFFADIPNLWRLHESAEPGKPADRTSLHSGFGVHVGYIGHDLHGLRIGPDGKLYFTIGDRGLHVPLPNGVLNSPDSGAVLRCNLDGSDLEIFATGLRNPQELAFDQFGNLFTVDNNSDVGDRARCVYVVERGDSGWRIGWQFLNNPVPHGPWMSERMWETQNEDQPAFIVPPFGYLASGPAGLTFTSGTGLPERLANHFFLCDFHGAANGSGVFSFAVKPKGASFELTDAQHFLWNILATDVQVGNDSSIYVLDWVNGWNKTGKGRIYKVFDPGTKDLPVVAETQRLIEEGMQNRSGEDLERLLAHSDQRIRLQAQFTLAERADVTRLIRVFEKQRNQLARIHALWGLGQIVERAQLEEQRSVAIQTLLGALSDTDAEIQAQAAKLLGDRRVAAACDRLLPLLESTNPRVQFFAAISLGKLHSKAAEQALFELLRRNADGDAMIRHASVMGLAGIGDVESLTARSSDPSAAVRLGAVVALRRLERPEISAFLDDTEPRVALEAARAIHDVPIDAVLPKLAGRADHLSSVGEAMWRRVINANFRLGTAEAAERLARLAADETNSGDLRVEALSALRQWEHPPKLDRVINLSRVLPDRDPGVVRAAIAPVFKDLVGAAPEPIALAAIRLGDEVRFHQLRLELPSRPPATPSDCGTRAARMIPGKVFPSMRSLRSIITTTRSRVNRSSSRLNHPEASRSKLLSRVLRSLRYCGPEAERPRSKKRGKRCDFR